MTQISDFFACFGCTKRESYRKDVIKEGISGGLMFVVKQPTVRYLLEPINLSDALLVQMIESENFVNKFIPKFGKFEFEEYIAEELKKAIFFTHDLSELFNTTLICEGNILGPAEIGNGLQTRLEQLRTDLKVYKYALDCDMIRKVCS